MLSYNHIQKCEGMIDKNRDAVANHHEKLVGTLALRTNLTPQQKQNHRAARFSNCFQASARLNLRLSKLIRFNSKHSQRWNSKTCWSQHQLAAVRPGLLVKR
jgi:hypothetical protein